MKLINHIRTLVILAASVWWTGSLHAQDINFEGIRKRTNEALKTNPFKVTGGLSANSVFYKSNANSSRSPFVYFINGNINVKFYQWDFPVSFSITNQESNLDYKLPYQFDRIALHPKYKWIQAHIGTVSMSFSPYTYNGWLFAGGGVELSPEKPYKLALFCGRLNKAVEDDGNWQTVPSFMRMGYGTHLKWEKERYKLGVIAFYALDDLASIRVVPESKKVLPQENAVLSVTAKVKVIKSIEIYGEYATSMLTGDLRAPAKTDTKFFFIPGKISSAYYGAYNLGASVTISQTTLGLRYERIDPEYRTLGAYFFNNDFENTTANIAHTMFKGTLSLSANLGKQNDNINSQKLNQTSRWVGSVNASYKISDKLNLSSSYSNFTSFTANQPDQFTKINQNPLMIQQPVDTLVYKQLSQNGTFRINYIISSQKNRTQSIALGYAINDVVNKENELVRKGQLSRFHNANVSHSLGLTAIHTTITTSVNYTHTYAAVMVTTLVGPSITLNSAFLKNKLNANTGISYNNASGSSSTQIINLRMGANFTPWKGHVFSMNIIELLRNANVPKQSMLSELTFSATYTYNF